MKKTLLIITAIFTTTLLSGALHRISNQGGWGYSNQQGWSYEGGTWNRTSQPADQRYFQPDYQTSSGSHGKDSFQSEKDRLLVRKIRSALEDSNVTEDPRKISIIVIDRRVILEGKADSNKEANDIIEVVKSVDGVGEIENRLPQYYEEKGSRSERTAKEERRPFGSFWGNKEEKTERPMTNADSSHLARRVMDALRSDFSRNNIEVFVTNDGVVTLKGTVRTMEDKRMIKDKVNNIQGVARINDQLQVK